MLIFVLKYNLSQEKYLPPPPPLLVTHLESNEMYKNGFRSRFCKINIWHQHCWLASSFSSSATENNFFKVCIFNLYLFHSAIFILKLQKNCLNESYVLPLLTVWVHFYFNPHFRCIASQHWSVTTSPHYTKLTLLLCSRVPDVPPQTRPLIMSDATSTALSSSALANWDCK